MRERVWYTLSAHFLRHTGCSSLRDCHDNASLWHGNASYVQEYLAIAWCHMIITCKPHGVNLIGALVFINKAPKSAQCVPDSSLLCLGTRLYKEIKVFGVPPCQQCHLVSRLLAPPGQHLFSAPLPLQ